MELSTAINKKQIEKISLIEERLWKGDGLSDIKFYPKGSVVKSYFWGLLKITAKEDEYYLRNYPDSTVEKIDIEEYLKENSERIYFNKDGQLMEKSFIKLFYTSGKVQKIYHKDIKRLYDKIIDPNTVEDFIEDF